MDSIRRGAEPRQPVSGVQVIDRAVVVMDAVAAGGPRGDGALALADLVATTGLSRATAYRLAVALESHGLLSRDDRGWFRLGGRLIGWGVLAAAGLDVVDEAPPVLARLVARTGESAQLYVREGDRRVCVAVRERPSGLRDTVPLGALMPLTAGSAAKVLLAWASDASRFDVGTGELASVRSRGWAESVAEREPGVASVSAPVFGAGGVVAAISVSGPTDRLGRRPGTRLGPAVVAAATELSERIRGVGGAVDAAGAGFVAPTVEPGSTKAGRSRP